MIANHLLWIAGIGGVIFYGIIFYWINRFVKKIEAKYSKRRVCLFSFLYSFFCRDVSWIAINQLSLPIKTFPMSDHKNISIR